MSRTDQNEIADVLHGVLTSPNVLDSNGEGANLVDAIDSLAQSVRSGLKWLGNGDAMTTMGAIEGHAVMMKESAELIANAINNLAVAVTNISIGDNQD